MDEMLGEFITDCSENLVEFENGVLELETNPKAPEVLDSMFRMIHSIKGASGFMAFGNLEGLTHKAENVLDLLRNDQGAVDQSLISTFLSVCDAMKTMFSAIQGTGQDGTESYSDLAEQLLKFENSFKNGTPIETESSVAVTPTASPEPSAVDESPEVEALLADAPAEAVPAAVAAPTHELDALQIESLKELGMYDGPETTESPKEEVTKEVELDALQIESLKSLGMYDGPETTEAPKTEAATVTELDALQIESLKELGMYDGPETKQVEKAPEAKLEPTKPEPIKPVEPEQELKQKIAAPVAKKESIRVDVDTLDKLVNLAGELVLVRNQLIELSKVNESQVFDASFADLDLVTGEIQRSLMTTRMQPISTVWSKMPRIVRDLSTQLGKDIKIEMIGENTELDKTIIEAISDPMTHIIRNCCDHGLETPEERVAAGKPAVGTIKLVAEHKGNWIHVDIIDDGKGINLDVLKKKALEKGLHTEAELEEMDDKEILHIIFHAGFSTKDQASKVSGRGVGMDVIRSNITKINGVVELFSTDGVGTHLKLKLPLTLAIVPAVIVSINDSRYAIPQNVVQEIALANKEDFEDINGRKFTRLRGQILPLVFAAEFLEEQEDAFTGHENFHYIVINADGYRYGLVIDKVMDIIEIVVKPIDSDDDFKYYAGATIMGDGKVALILDTVKIVELSKINKLVDDGSLNDGLDEAGNLGVASSTDLTLTFKLRNNQRYLIQLSKTSRIEEIPKSEIEQRQLGNYVNFNGKVIRVIDLAELLEIKPTANDLGMDSQSIKALYFEFNGQGIAIDVGFEHTLLSHQYELQASSHSEFVIGTAVIDNKMYEALYLEDYLDKLVNESGMGANYDQATANNIIEQGNIDIDKQDLESAVLSFSINGLCFGVDLNSINEIISGEIVTKTPGSRASVEGLLNLRGEIMITRNLAKVLEINSNEFEAEVLDDPSEPDERRKIELANNRSSIIIHNKSNKICLQISNVEEILNLSKKDFYPTPENLPENLLQYVKGVYNRDKTMLLLLDEEKLISDVIRSTNV